MKKLSISQNILGHLMINGKKSSDSIQMAFKTTTDSLEGWRSSDKERFKSVMSEMGLSREAAAILASI